MLEHSQLAQLLSGKSKNNPIWICSIPDRARIVLGCSTGAVYLSRESAQHILNDHSDIDTFQLLLLPIAIQKGQLLRETRRPQFINSLYKESDEKNYFVAMKTARNGHELWVSSMYRVEARQIDVNGGDKTSAIMLLRESFHRTLDINRWLQICDNAF
jgi:hypothetical protein